MQPATKWNAPQQRLSEAMLLCRRQHVLFKLSQQQSSVNGGQEVWQLPGGLTWSDATRILLRYICWLVLHESSINSFLGSGCPLSIRWNPTQDAVLGP